MMAKDTDTPTWSHSLR